MPFFLDISLLTQDAVLRCNNYHAITSNIHFMKRTQNLKNTHELIFEDKDFLKFYCRVQVLKTFKLSYHSKNQLWVVRAMH